MEDGMECGLSREEDREGARELESLLPRER